MVERRLAPSRFSRVRPVADAILYEGYLLYPYRASSGKNQVRWQFGVLAPRTWVEANVPHNKGMAGSAESWFQRTECLCEAPVDATVHVRLRWLQLQVKTVELDAGRGFVPVDELEADGGTQRPFDEAVPQEHDVSCSLADLLAGPRTFPVALSEARAEQPLTTPDDVSARAVRRRWPVSASITLAAERADTPFRCHRLRVVVENAVSGDHAGDDRRTVLRRSLIATHTLLALDAGSFLSSLDPPEWARIAAAECRNVHAFPVLAGEPDDTDLLLSAPIILYDHPQIAPESSTQLFDGTEIDEILSLRTMTLSDEEKREVRATDPRAADLLDRVDLMPPEALAKLHGAVRGLRPVPPRTEGADEDTRGADADPLDGPVLDSVVIAGRRVVPGSSVRLRPRARGTDAHDMFLDGRAARVCGVLTDVDGSCHLAVTIDDDPGADLHGWYGRFRYFSPDEVEPMTEGG